MLDIIFGIFLFFVGIYLLSFGIFLLRYIISYNKAARYIQERSIDSGILVRHGMVIDQETGQVRGTSAPSNYAIKTFW